MVATFEPNLSGFPQSCQTVWYYELTDFTYYDFTVSPLDSPILRSDDHFALLHFQWLDEFSPGDSSKEEC